VTGSEKHSAYYGTELITTVKKFCNTGPGAGSTKHFTVVIYTYIGVASAKILCSYTDIGTFLSKSSHLAATLGVTKMNDSHCYKSGHTLLCCLSPTSVENRGRIQNALFFFLTYEWAQYVKL
jgi:hypothetical protein